jgi:hypothetical protein
MMVQRWLSVTLLGLLVGGCASAPDAAPTRSEFEDLRDTVATSRGARDALQARCRADVVLKSGDEQALIGAMLDVDTAEVPDVYCARLIAAIARGDVSYADFVAMTDGSADPAMLRRFLRTMRLDPSAVAI